MGNQRGVEELFQAWGMPCRMIYLMSLSWSLSYRAKAEAMRRLATTAMDDIKPRLLQIAESYAALAEGFDDAARRRRPPNLPENPGP
jgi:hypothetical protein